MAIESSADKAGKKRRRIARRGWLSACEAQLCEYRFFVPSDDPVEDDDVVRVVAQNGTMRERLARSIAFDYVMLVDDLGRTCLSQVLRELEARPTARFAWLTGCDLGSFAVLSTDVAMLLSMMPGARSLNVLRSLTVFYDAQRLVASASGSIDQFCANYVHAREGSELEGDWPRLADIPSRRPMLRQRPPACLEPAPFERAVDWSLVDQRLAAHDNCCVRPEAVACAAYRGRTLIPTVGGVEGAILASFPGSGNTWTRLMVEYASGLLTGSIYDDDQLKASLPAEGNRNTSAVVLVKAHVMPRQYLGLVRTTKVVLVVRHPLDAIWAEFQRRVASDDRSHVNVVQHLGPNLRRLFARYALCMGCKWALYALAHAELGSRVALHKLKYEHLVESDSSLGAVLAFLGLEPHGHRVDCARTLAFDPNVRRASSKKMTAVCAMSLAAVFPRKDVVTRRRRQLPSVRNKRLHAMSGNE